MVDLGIREDFSARFRNEARPPCQLYLISPPLLDERFPAKLREAGEAGKVAAFQLRLKEMDDHAIARAAEPLQRICADLDIAFIVNDSTALAKRLGADGVHLGQQDGDPGEARKLLGRDAQIGVTCHNSRHLAMEAAESGADYVAFGAFFPTGTKKVQHYAEVDLISWWTTLFGTPCVAIGGLNAENSSPIVQAGADFLAVSSAIWDAPQGPAAAVRAFKTVLEARS